MNFSKYNIKFLIYMVLILVFINCDSTDTKQNKKITAFIGKVKVNLEIVATEESREKGLMYRSKLGLYEGMIFVFPFPRETSFWMKNTIIPLDLAYVDENERIVEIKSMPVDDGLTTYPSKVPILYAIELNYGWFKKEELEIGTLVRLPYKIKGY